MADIKDMVRLLRKLSPGEEALLRSVAKCVSRKDLRQIRTLIKQRKVGAVPCDARSLSASVPRLQTNDSSLTAFVDSINAHIWSRSKAALFEQFSQTIMTSLPEMIAPGIVGFEQVKKAVALQLFSTDPSHILLLGDPGTGKTRILKAASDLSPITSFGLGSGTSGAGLAVTMKGNDIHKGLLPLADGGLCAIDELNLMKDGSRAALYSAMEDGKVSYSKGGHHHTFDARVSVLATANPKGDQFKGTDPDALKKQLPFDPALLTRFHLVFLIRKPDAAQFREISENILRTTGGLSDSDVSFLKDYVAHAREIHKVTLPKAFEKEIVDFVSSIKEKEDRFLIEVSPRLVVGFIKLAKAAARMELRDCVRQQDVDLVKDIIQHSLSVK